jgi:hypothetical protein
MFIEAPAHPLVDIPSISGYIDPLFSRTQRKESNHDEGRNAEHAGHDEAAAEDAGKNGSGSG